MAHRRSRPLVIREGVPEALRSVSDPLWEDVAAVRGLVTAYGLTGTIREDIRERLEEIPGFERFGVFRRAYCLAHGFESPRWPGHVDLQSARDAGIDVQSLVRFRAGIM